MKQYEMRQTVEAVQFDGTPAQAADIIAWLAQTGVRARYDSTDPEDPRLVVGWGGMSVRQDEWVAQVDDSSNVVKYNDSEFQRMFKETGL